MTMTVVVPSVAVKTAEAGMTKASGTVSDKRSLLYFFRQAGRRTGNVSHLGLLKGAFIFFPGRSQVRVLEHGQQLPFMDIASPVDVKLFHRSADLRLDGGL
jgi:hypothetical protein